MDGSCGMPRHRGDRAHALGPNECVTPGTYGDDYFVMLHQCGSHWTLIFALNAKSHWGGYPLPQINLGDFFEGWLKGRAWG